jgi:hypothetical protein
MEDAMKMFSTVVTAFSLVAAGIVTPPSVAQAAGARRFHASTCLVKSGTATFNSAGQIGNATSGEVVLWCPLISDPSVGLPAASAAVRVNVFSNGCIGGVSGVSTNVSNVPAAGGPSSSPGSSSPSCVPGVYELTPSIPAVGANDYPVLEVRLRGAISGSTNTFFGYRLMNF